MLIPLGIYILAEPIKQIHKIRGLNMALTKRVVTDQITINGDGVMFIREATIIEEDGVELSRKNMRFTVFPDKEVHPDVQDTEGLVAQLKPLVHTSERIAKYKQIKADKDKFKDM
jgi:hypothetical protein